MKKSYIFFSLILYSSVSIICADRVDTLNELFKYRYWREMYFLCKDNVRVIERWMDIEEHFYAKDLIPTIDENVLIIMNVENDPVVTNDNAEYKTRQAHQFLSCKYALELKQCYDIVAELAVQCQRITDLSDTITCLKRLIKTLKENDQMTLRMHGALSFFYLLSPHTLFNKDVFDMVEDFLVFSRTKIYDERRCITTRETIHAELISIDKHISKILHRFKVFSTMFCYRASPEVDEYGISYTRAKQKSTMNNSNDLDLLTCQAISVIQIVRNQFINSFDNFSGFCFEPISNTTLSIKKDQLTVERINLLLENPGWAEIKFLRIKEHRHTKLSSAFLVSLSSNERIVSYETLYNKSQIAHLILSCKYTLVLKECFDYAIFMWNQCKQNTDDIGSGVSLDNRLAQFKTTAEKSDPLLLRLRYALSFFYRLTPEMEYNKEVFNIIESFRTSFVVGDDTPNVENVMSEFLRRLREFFIEFCWPEGLFDLTPIPEHTMDNDDLQVFIKKINSFIETDYDNFGFGVV